MFYGADVKRRTKPGKIVTDAKGGESWHNFALAVDFCLLHQDGVVTWDMIEDLDRYQMSGYKAIDDRHYVYLPNYVFLRMD